MSPDEQKTTAPTQQRQPQNQQRPQGQRPNERPRGDRPRNDQPRPRRSPEDRNVVFIGSKPPMNYVLAVVTQFNSGSAEVAIRARGKAIAGAVDVAEIVRNKFFTKATVKNVSIGTETVTGDDGRKRSVSAIDIRLFNTEVGAQGIKPSLPQQNAPQNPPVEPAPAQKSGGV